MDFDFIVRETMRYTYPFYAGAALCLAMLELIWYRRVASTPIRLVRAVMWSLTFIAIALLSATAGASPLLSIDTVRPYIALVRLITTAVLFVAIVVMVRPLLRMGREEQ